MAVGQLLALWGILSGRGSTAWREGIAILITAAVAASIALVGQTYHIPGDLGAFLLTWMLLILPLIYLLEASAPCVVYLAGITAWAGYEQGMGGHGVLFAPKPLRVIRALSPAGGNWKRHLAVAGIDHTLGHASVELYHHMLHTCDTNVVTVPVLASETELNRAWDGRLLLGHHLAALLDDLDA